MIPASTMLPAPAVAALQAAARAFPHKPEPGDCQARRTLMDTTITAVRLVYPEHFQEER